MSFTITLKPSGEQFTVNPGEAILDSAIRQGVAMPYGCRSGRCGACVANIVEGEISYPYGEPIALDTTNPNICLPCACKPEGDVTLEVKTISQQEEIKVRMLPCRVHQIDHLAHDVIRLMLKLPDGQRLQFRAGQYVEFVLADGRHRAFSIANAPHDDAFIELHIRHVDGGKFTDWAFSQMEEKAILRIEAPHGSFVLDEKSQRPMIFMGGGTGFAPLKGQIEHAFHMGISRPMTLYWGVRSKRDLYLPELPKTWEAGFDHFKFIPVLSEPDADWEGRTGYVHEAVLADIDNLADHDIYMAGPPIMVKSGRDAFLAAGVSDEHMHYDSFDYADDSKLKK
jgi:CDP-4-dehydro-6-deoxyglucose reductase